MLDRESFELGWFMSRTPVEVSGDGGVIIMTDIIMMTIEPC